MRERKRTRLRWPVVVYLICFALSGRALAVPELIPVGEAVGIEITVDGVLVAGVSRVDTAEGAVSPAEAAGIRAGDVITALNGTDVGSAAELASALAGLAAPEAELTVRRNGRELLVRVEPAAAEDGSRLGLWLRDGVTGIGTVTYIDPETGAFGALGHGVNDSQSGALLSVENGSVWRARIVSVVRGEAGAPGELSGCFFAGDALGRIDRNTAHGIFGVMASPLDWAGAPIPVASPEEVVPGPATVRTCVSGGEAREYRVEIARAGVMSGEGRDLTVRVTDPDLLALTGGIVQGMSGSPILQNGKLVVAVTHVLTGDPARGYGIFAVNMLREAAAAA